MSRPRRATLATFGTLGDIYPFIGLAHALSARGIVPTLAAPLMHRAAVEDEGIAYARLRPSIDDVAAALGIDLRGAFDLMLRNPHFILDEIYLRFLRETFEDVTAAAEGADVLFSHSLLVGAHQAAEMLRLPSARVALAPLHLQSATAPALTPGAPYRLEPRGRGAVSYNRVVRRIVRLVTDARMARLRTFRAETGLPPTREDFFLDFGRDNRADAIFGLWSPPFAPAQPDQPSNLAVPGFPFHVSRDPARRGLDPALQAFLKAGDPPIVFTLGSFAPDVSGAFYDHSLAAARALGCRAVLLAGERDAARLTPEVGGHEHVCARAPHALLFPHARCIVHHGGIGTTAEAMRAGKPQIVVPFFGDQPDHGARITRLGLGLTLTLPRWDASSAAALLRRVLAGEYDDAARRFATTIAADPGLDALADWADVTSRGCSDWREAQPVRRFPPKSRL